MNNKSSKYNTRNNLNSISINHHLNPNVNVNMNVNSNVSTNQNQNQIHNHNHKALQPSSLQLRQQRKGYVSSKQRVQEQMIGNYYQDKYSNLMNKITHKNKQGQGNNANHTNNNNAKSINQRLCVHKQAGNSKGSNPSNLVNRQNFKQTVMKAKRQQQRQRQKMNLINRQNKDNRQNNFNSHFKSNKYSSSNNSNNNNDLTNRSNTQRSKSNGSKERKNVQRNEASSPEIKHKVIDQSTTSVMNKGNFKSSLLQTKRSLEKQQRQSSQIYHQLQSSIINELYSPSPKNIESGKYNSIKIQERVRERRSPKSTSRHNSSVNQEYLFEQNNVTAKVSNYSDYFPMSVQDYSEPRETIQIIQNDDDLDLGKQYTSENLRKQQNLLNNVLNKEIRDSIRNSIRSNEKEIERSNSKRKSHSSKSPSNKAKSMEKSFSKKSQKDRKSLSVQKPQWNSNFHSRGSSSPPNSKRKSSLSSRSKSKQQSYFSSKRQTSTERGNRHVKIAAGSIKEEENSSQDQPVKSEQIKSYQTHQPNKSTYKSKGSVDLAFEDQGDSKEKSSIHASYKDQNQSRSKSGKQSVQDQDQMSDQGIEFVAPTNQLSLGDMEFDEDKGVVHHTYDSSGRSQLGSVNRERKDSAFSIPTIPCNRNQMSMLSRFSMTSDEGQIIREKLQHQIVQNQFGPYQNALEMMRQLILDYPNAWPIYVVGQRILDDRAQYQSKHQIQETLLIDYERKIESLKSVKMKRDAFVNKSEKSTQEIIEQNKIKILNLIRKVSIQQM